MPLYIAILLACYRLLPGRLVHHRPTERVRALRAEVRANLGAGGKRHG